MLVDFFSGVYMFWCQPILSEGQSSAKNLGLYERRGSITHEHSAFH